MENLKLKNIYKVIKIVSIVNKFMFDIKFLFTFE